MSLFGWLDRVLAPDPTTHTHCPRCGHYVKIAAIAAEEAKWRDRLFPSPVDQFLDSWDMTSISGETRCAICGTWYRPERRLLPPLPDRAILELIEKGTPDK